MLVHLLSQILQKQILILIVANIIEIIQVITDVEEDLQQKKQN